MGLMKATNVARAVPPRVDLSDALDHMRANLSQQIERIGIKANEPVPWGKKLDGLLGEARQAFDDAHKFLRKAPTGAELLDQAMKIVEERVTAQESQAGQGAGGLSKRDVRAIVPDHAEVARLAADAYQALSGKGISTRRVRPDDIIREARTAWRSQVEKLSRDGQINLLAVGMNGGLRGVLEEARVNLAKKELRVTGDTLIAQATELLSAKIDTLPHAGRGIRLSDVAGLKGSDPQLAGWVADATTHTSHQAGLTRELATIAHRRADTLGFSAGPAEAAPLTILSLGDAEHIDRVMQEYVDGLARHVPEGERESKQDLTKWVQDPDDTFMIRPFVRGEEVVGGAHTQIAEAPDWSIQKNTFGSLEYFWADQKTDMQAVVKAGLEALHNTDGGPPPGVFADIPDGASAKDKEAMRAALRAEGFTPFYAGKQPSLGKGKPSTDVEMWVRLEPGQELTREAVQGYVNAYFASFASIEGDEAKLRGDAAYRDISEHIAKQFEPTAFSLKGTDRITELMDPYRRGLGQHVPEDDLESKKNLIKWVKSRKDTFNITPLLVGDEVVGGAQTQLPKKWKEHHNAFGSLEYFWAHQQADVQRAVRAGLETLRNTKAGSPKGVFADIPLSASAEDKETMRAALSAEGFKLLYSGKQPPLEDDKPSTDVEIWVKSDQKLTQQDYREYFEAYWSTFDFIIGDKEKVDKSVKEKLRETDAFQELLRHISTL
jgi:hypothetical protein